MTIVNVDASGLEWVCGTFLSQCPVATAEILKGVDQHSLNLETFGLPSRLIAKKFVFRLIYGGTEYSYSVDSDFAEVSTSQKFWKDVIEKFYSKYYGWAEWHKILMHEATTTGQLVMPTGRIYSYSLNKYGDWPRTTILNYPVQGLGADIMAIIRVAFYKRFKAAKAAGRIQFGCVISSVHDSIVCDVPSEEVEVIIELYKESFKVAPMLFKQWFGVEFNLPLRCEISTGPNLSDLEEIK